MNGLLIIDKSAGMTSFDVVRVVRRLAGTRKVGHAGTLDPMATGVLPVAVGTATRLLEYLTAAEKVYRTTLTLGETTDTQDAEGTILETRPWSDVTLEQVQAAIETFVGEIEQVPPMYSALKQNGVPLYRLARQGVEVERKARKVTITAIDIDTFEPPELTLTVTCSKGTYIRTLGADLGEALGCGAHLSMLRRTRNGLFSEAESMTIESLQQLRERGEELPWLSPAAALADWQDVQVDGEPLKRLLDGVSPAEDQVGCSRTLRQGDRVRLMNGADLVALAEYAPEAMALKLGDFKIFKVFPQVTGCR